MVLLIVTENKTKEGGHIIVEHFQSQGKQQQLHVFIKNKRGLLYKSSSLTVR